MTFVKVRPEQALSTTAAGVEIYLPVSGMIDISKEVARLKKELEQTQKYIKAQSKKIDNKEFVRNAPKEIVEVEKTKLKEAQDKASKIEQQIKSLK